MKNLQLSLIKKWFDLTKSGEKIEDYREITPYWITRIYFKDDSCDVLEFINYLKNPSYYKTPIDIYCRKNGFKLKPFTQNTMTWAYPKKRRHR